MFGGSEKVYVVEVFTNNLIDEIPRNYFNAKLIGGISAGADIPSTIINGVLSNPTASLKDYFRYGRDKYEWRLPTISYFYSAAKFSEVVTIIQNLEGKVIEVLQYFYGVPDLDSWAKFEILVNFGYSALQGSSNTSTNDWYNSGFFLNTRTATSTTTVTTTTTVTNPDGTTSTSVETKTHTITSNYNTTYSYSHAYESAGRFFAVLKVNYNEYNSEGYSFDSEHEMVISIASPPLDNWYLVAYKIPGNNEVKVIRYREASNVYPQLNNKHTTLDKTILPIGIFRQFFVSIDSDKNSNVYKTTKKLVKKIQVDADDILEEINAQTELSKIHGTHLYLGISPWTTDEHSKLYIYEFFKYIYSFAGNTKANYNSQTLQTLNSAQGIITIEEQKFNYKLGFGYIDSQIKGGVIAPLGKVQLIRNTRSDSFFGLTALGNFSSYSGSTQISVNSQLIIQKQITATTYEEITIQGIYAVHILPHRKNFTEGKGIPLSDKTNFLIPLSLDILKQLAIAKQEAVIYDSLKMVVQGAYSYKVKKFSILSLAIGIAFSFVTSGLSLSAWLASGALAKILVSFVLNLVLSQIDPAIGMLVGAVVGFAMMGGFSGGGLNFSNLNLSDVLLKGVGAIQKVLELKISNEVKALEKAWEDFHNLVENLDEILRQAKDGMAYVPGLDPLTHLSSKTAIIYEDSGSFYERSKRTNLAPVIKSGISDYHSKALNCWESLNRTTLV